MSEPDRLAPLINAAGPVFMALVFAWGITSCYETRRRYNLEEQRLEQEMKCEEAPEGKR